MDTKANQWADNVLLQQEYEIVSAEQKEMPKSAWVTGNIELRHLRARENIHQPSAIQTHGYLLVMDGDTYLITQVSGNVTDLGYTYDDLLSKKLRDVINMDDMEKIPIRAREFKPMVSFQVDFGVGDLKKTFTGQFHVRGKWSFLEFERPVSDSASAQFPLRILRQQLVGVNGTAEGCQLLTDAVQQSTGYDRVMGTCFILTRMAKLLQRRSNLGARAVV